MSKPHKWVKETYRTKQTALHVTKLQLNKYIALLKRYKVIWVC